MGTTTMPSVNLSVNDPNSATRTGLTDNPNAYVSEGFGGNATVGGSALAPMPGMLGEEPAQFGSYEVKNGQVVHKESGISMSPNAPFLQSNNGFVRLLPQQRAAAYARGLGGSGQGATLIRGPGGGTNASQGNGGAASVAQKVGPNESVSSSGDQSTVKKPKTNASSIGRSLIGNSAAGGNATTGGNSMLGG